MNSPMRGASQVEPRPTVAVTLSVPLGRSLLSDSCAFGHRQLGEDLAHRAVEQLALLGEDQAAGMAVEQRDVAALSSSALIWRLTADWLRFRASPARVKLPASATA